jgi:hypothetical protein
VCLCVRMRMRVGCRGGQDGGMHTPQMSGLGVGVRPRGFIHSFARHGFQNERVGTFYPRCS